MLILDLYLYLYYIFLGFETLKDGSTALIIKPGFRYTYIYIDNCSLYTAM